MTGTIPVFKLHGSLNWTLNGPSIVAFQDMRPAFRHGGTAAIIPPVPEKPVPPWLHEIWREAESSLRRSDVWVMCGYSMPAYDTGVLRLLKTAGNRRPLTILLLSPEADAIQKRWTGLLPEASIICLPPRVVAPIAPSGEGRTRLDRRRGPPTMRSCAVIERDLPLPHTPRGEE